MVGVKEPGLLVYGDRFAAAEGAGGPQECLVDGEVLGRQAAAFGDLG
ncbi:hypothetical protein [Frankia sp. R82]|nr:hypothetical protein [Frankia sp. R82]MCM3886814.1 hypothetical protein [Frankia sp. R82]